MSEPQIVRTDRGAVNARILSKETKADFRRVEAASLKMRAEFTSGEGKRMFLRMFNTLQLNAHFVSVIARTRLDHQEVETAEAALRADIEAAKNTLDAALDDAEALFKANGINTPATYDTKPMQIEVGILSSSGRRYLEVLHQFDQLMPLWATLEIHDVISPQTLDKQRGVLKRQIKSIATSARRMASGLRRRMHASGTSEPAAGSATDPAEPMAELAQPDAVGPQSSGA